MSLLSQSQCHSRPIKIASAHLLDLHAPPESSLHFSLFSVFLIQVTLQEGSGCGMHTCVGTAPSACCTQAVPRCSAIAVHARRSAQEPLCVEQTCRMCCMIISTTGIEAPLSLPSCCMWLTSLRPPISGNPGSAFVRTNLSLATLFAYPTKGGQTRWSPRLTEEVQKLQRQPHSSLQRDRTCVARLGRKAFH